MRVSIREELDAHFRHFNAGELATAARAYVAHIRTGGKIFLSLAGGFSMAGLGNLLARMIRADCVHAISCTGGVLEEDIFNLLTPAEDRVKVDPRSLTGDTAARLRRLGYRTVGNTGFPNSSAAAVKRLLLKEWLKADRRGDRRFPAEYIFEMLQTGDFEADGNTESSWMLAAMKADLPVYVPGWENSITGGFFSAAVMTGQLSNHSCVKTGTEQFQSVMHWYLRVHRCPSTRPAGFFQVGGGIAGDFAICVAPAVIEDLGKDDMPFWGFFVQVSDACTSYGGYSGAPPNEKITWGKLDLDTPRFWIESDASIVVPLIFSYVLDNVESK